MRVRKKSKAWNSLSSYSDAKYVGGDFQDLGLLAGLPSHRGQEAQKGIEAPVLFQPMFKVRLN